MIDFGQRPAVLGTQRPRQTPYLGEYIAIAYLDTSELVGKVKIHLVKVGIFSYCWEFSPPKIMILIPRIAIKIPGLL